MAAEGRAVRVSGLPLDIPDNRLLDKIHIHFLRRKNGGGEIVSVTISKTTPGTAFITFEDSEVALKLAQQGKHVFKVGDKNYDVIVSLHHESLDVDKVLLHMSVTVDHSKLPEGKTTLLAMQRSFPGVHITFDSHKDLCSLDGRYTEVQKLSSLLLGSFESQTPGDRQLSWTESKDRVDLPLDMPANSPIPLDMPANSPLGTDEAFGLTKQPLQWTEELDVELHTARNSGLDQLSTDSHQQLHEILSEGEWNMEPESGPSFEDFSFVVDTDIFRYLHKYCAKEYQNILKRHRVEVLDETCQDITTLYLKPKKGLSERGMGPIKRARQDLAQLYQDKGSQLRKEQISKTGIPEKGLEQAIETLEHRLPQLMIEEEEGNVYLVGSGSDVSEAKQFITDVKGMRVDREVHSNHLVVHSPSNFPFSQQIPSELPAQSDIFQPLGNKYQASDDLFSSNRNDQASKDEGQNSNARRHNYGDLKYLDEHTCSSRFTQNLQSRVMNDDIFFVRRNDTPVERNDLTNLKRMETSDLGNMEKFTGFPSVSPTSPKLSTLDMDRRTVDNPDLRSKETQFKGPPDNNSDGTEKQLKSAKVRKTKRVESGKELKMAANFSRDRCTGNLADTRFAEEPKTTAKLEEGAKLDEGHERPLDVGQPRSLPFIKPSMNSTLKPNPVPGSGSGLSKMDILVQKGDVKKHGHVPSNYTGKKPVMMPAYSTESQPFSFGHMDLCGDTGRSPAMTSGLALKRSNSFSGRIRTGQDKHMVADMSGRQKGKVQGSQKREFFTVDVPMAIKHWLYIKSIYSSEIDNLTSDLQLKEDISKEEFALCLRGADLEKVKECQHGLKGLISLVETDFDARTLPLSIFGVSDSKDKTFLDFSAGLKQRYERVKILVMSKSVMILGPRLMCEEVEAAVKNIFYTGVRCAKSESGSIHKPSVLSISPDHVTLNSHSEPPTEYPTLTTTENAQVVTKKNLYKISDQINAWDSKKVPADQTKGTKFTNVDQDSQNQDSRDQDNQDQGDQVRDWGKVERKQVAEEGSEMVPALKLQKGEGGTSNKESMKTDNHVISVRRNEEDEQIDEHRMIPNLQKNIEIEADSHNTESFTESVDPGSSVSQAGNVLAPLEGPDVPLSDGMTSQCQKEAHGSCNRSPPDVQQGSWGIRGTMSIRESTITIPGFIRDTTLRIIYEIPDGIQGEHDPCPGAPFKGNRFDAFLPLNEATKKLLPLLEKAFYKGLTFAIKTESPGGQEKGVVREARVVWGNIPHKTHIEGGTSKNGYPDSTYIRRLTQTLKTAGLEE